MNHRKTPRERPRHVAATPPAPVPRKSPFALEAGDHRWKIKALPDHLRAELDRRIHDGTYGSYSILSKWLTAEGFPISGPSLHRYAQGFERKLQAIRLATQQAREVCKQFKDDDTSMRDALLRLVQTQLFQVLVATYEKEPVASIREGDRRDQAEDQGQAFAPVNIHALARTVASLAKSDLEQRKWADRARASLAKVEKKIAVARAKGLSVDAASEIRNVLLEIKHESHA